MALKTKKHVTYGPDGAVVDCLFCRITNGGESNPLWYSDARVSVFVPKHSLAGRLHFLVVPKAHVHQLGRGMLETKALSSLLDHMERVACEALTTALAAGISHAPLAAPPPGFTFSTEDRHHALPPNCSLAFHRPPFNSVDHLHLHAICKPYTDVFQRLKFTPGMMKCLLMIFYLSSR